jgi:hypothetical protein
MKMKILLIGISVWGVLFSNVVKSQIIASEVQGVAPMLVHFEASCTATEFHHALFTWNFGDNQAGVWGTDFKSQNRAEGPVTAHLFETPGIFDVMLTKTQEDGSTFSDTMTITVLDPTTVFAGNLTVCVNPANDPDFSAAPAGALHINTDSIHTITSYATPGHRILLKRGGVWTIYTTPNWPENSGLVVIGAYGEGINPNSLGIYENNPVVIVNGGDFLPIGFKQNWKIMDITLSDPSKQNGSFGGAESFKKWLFLRLKVDGFDVPIGWSTWNDPNGNTHADLMGIVSCIFENAAVNVGYVGSERLMILGSIFRNASESHVLRVWQCYKGIIAHNQISGSSINSNTGRHALKFHGPPESQIATTEWSHLNKRTQFSVIADNVFGTSGPWPVMVAPQDNGSDERISHIIFERNLYFSDFGTPSSLSLQPSVIFTFIGQNITVRNNIIDASSNGTYFTGISVSKTNATPSPDQIEIYHNTIYKYADPNGQIWYGIAIPDICGLVTVRNNLVEFPYVCAGHFSVYNGSPNTVYTDNVLNSTVTFENPDDPNPLLRSFRLHPNSLSAINMGYILSVVHNDFDGVERPQGSGYDIGAYEYVTPIGIEENYISINSKIYPNPTSGILNIETNDQILNIEIFDMTGKSCAQFQNINTVNLSFLPSGFYMIKIYTQNGSPIIRKIAIIK